MASDVADFPKRVVLTIKLCLVSMAWSTLMWGRRRGRMGKEDILRHHGQLHFRSSHIIRDSRSDTNNCLARDESRAGMEHVS
jgi:hypothetical protein